MVVADFSRRKGAVACHAQVIPSAVSDCSRVCVFALPYIVSGKPVVICRDRPHLPVWHATRQLLFQTVLFSFFLFTAQSRRTLIERREVIAAAFLCRFSSAFKLVLVDRMIGLRWTFIMQSCADLCVSATVGAHNQL